MSIAFEAKPAICKYGTDHSIAYCMKCPNDPTGWYQAPWKITKDEFGDFLFQDWPNPDIYSCEDMD